MNKTTILSADAINETHLVGAGVKMGTGCSLGNHISIADNCTIGDNVVIGNNVKIMANATIESGACICDEVHLGESCHIASGVVFTHVDNGLPGNAMAVHASASVGANSTICQADIGQNAIVKPGTVVTRTVPSNAIVSGNPAKITGYIGADIVDQEEHSIYTRNEPYISKTGARVFSVPQFSDMRGDLSVVEIEDLLPFPVRRIFYTYNIDTELVRGEHAHIHCQQFLMAVAGSVNVVCDNGQFREEFILDNPGVGLHIPPLCWGVQYKHSNDNILLVLASHSYDADDYIRDYGAFLKHIASVS